MNVEPGQRWTFIHSSGERTEYVVDEDYNGGGYVLLLNEETGRFAHVTTHWLRRTGEDRLPGYWERAA
jgi:hypothetical protein